MIVTEDEIKKWLSKYYWDSKPTRKLIKTVAKDVYEDEGTVLFTLNGSPPKGYALYSPGHKILLIFDAWLDRKKTLRDVKIEGVNQDGGY